MLKDLFLGSLPSVKLVTIRRQVQSLQFGDMKCFRSRILNFEINCTNMLKLGFSVHLGE